MAVAAPARPPLFSFGVLADVQYGDKDNGDIEDREQRYREAPQKLATAIDHFNSASAELSFVLTLGDIIDGNKTEEKTQSDFEVVMEILQKLNVRPVHHLFGNHCLVISRPTLLERLCMPGRFYDVPLHAGWRLAVLDTMDMSDKWPADSDNYKEAQEYRASHPLDDMNPQMSDWNGGLSSNQMTWLKDTLSAAERHQEKVIVAGHHPVVEGAAPATHLLWNHIEVVELLTASPSVVLVFAGHYHPGGYKQVGAAHFVTVPAILEAPEDSNAYCIVRVFDEHMYMEGHGTVPTRELSIPGTTPAV
eukprot:SM000146S00943  [mRNA]  locus=s146:49108:51623:- [translate_table: standard]